MRKVALVACAAVTALAGGTASASNSMNITASQAAKMLSVPDCAAGFTKSGATGDPKGAHSWTCKTSVACPAGPPGYPGGVYNDAKAVVANGVVTFSYSCAYLTPLH